MDLDQVSGLHLRYFLAVIDHGSVAGAARVLGVAQPSLSQQVRLLEKRVGVRLFDRSASGMRPTPAGGELAVAAQAWLSAAGTLGSRRPSVRVGLPRGADRAVLGAVRERLGENLALTECATSAAAALIRGCRLDAAVIREPLGQTPHGLRTTRLLVRPLGILGRAEDVATLVRTPDGLVPIASLDGLSLLWFNESRAPGFARSVMDALREHGWDPDLVEADPASSTVTEDALLHAAGLVMVRPRPSLLGPGLDWAELTPRKDETFSLLRRR